MKTVRRLTALLPVLVMLFCMAMPVCAQKNKTAPRSTAQKKTAARQSPQKKKTATTPKKPTAASTKKGTAPQTKKSSDQKTSVASLESQKKQLQKDTEAKKKKKAQVERKVKAGMQNLLIINQEITEKRRLIDTIRNDISLLDRQISRLNRQLDTLNRELEGRKQRYMKSVRYMRKNRSVPSQMMFVFSADNFNQMYRRMRFTQQYAAFQRSQGEALKNKQAQVEEKRTELNLTKHRKTLLLTRGEQEQQLLEGKQNEQQQQVKQLQKEQQTLAAYIQQQQRQEMELNRKIDQLIQEELERQRKKAEAEERKRKAEEAARAKEQANGGKKQKETAPAKGGKKSDGGYRMPSSSQDAVLTGNFESNKGKLPIPVVGAYKVVRGFGKYAVEGLKNVMLDSKGVHLKGLPGARVQCVFDGEVSGVFRQSGQYIVMVRHGKYISVYFGLQTCSVASGQKVSTRQVLGTTGAEGLMQFQLRNWTKLLNPMQWLAR